MKKAIMMILVLATALLLPVRADAQLVPANGTVKQLDGQGRLQAILKYKNGHLLRKRLYDGSGQLLLDTVYREGKPVKIITYYPSGQLKSVWSQKKGEAQFYYPTVTRNATVAVEDISK